MRSASVRRRWWVPAAMLVLSLAGSGCGESSKPAFHSEKAAPVPVDSLYAHAGDAVLEGQAAAAVSDTADRETRTMLELDFEQGGAGFLRPQADGKGTAKALEESSGITVDPVSGGKALHIAGGVNGAATYRSPPIPVEPNATYSLTYSVRTEKLEGRDGRQYRTGTAEPLFFAVPSYQHNPASFLQSADKRKKTLVRPSAEVRGPNKTGTNPWATHTLQFTAPGQANYMILSFDHSRTSDDKGLGGTTDGDVWFDSIKLTSVAQPLHARYRNPDDLNASPSPLQLRVELPAEDGGAETRSALFAPAPSTVKFKRRVPPAGMLSLAAGVLREGWLPGRGGIKFTVRVVDASGKRTVAREETLYPGREESDRQWREMMIDLGSWAGQDVTLELETAATSAGAPGALPGGAAVWGDPILFSRDGKGRLVVLTVIDTVSVSHVSAYGYERQTMPNLERLARDGTLFEETRSAAPWTLPSFASIFTGLDAVRHGAGERAWGEVVWRRPLPERFVTLAECLRAHGFQTVAFMNNPYLTSTFGLGQGFSTYRDYGVGTKTGAGEVGVDRAIRWLEEHRGYDRLLVMHLMDSHGPYRPPSSYANKFTKMLYRGRFKGGMKGKAYLDLAQGDAPAQDEETRRQVRDLYDGALLYADAQMGRLYDAVQKLSGTPDVTFVVTADHGEELWEHGGYEHGHQAYEEMLRVPLVVEGPGVKAGQRVKVPVHLTDLVPSLMGLLGMKAPEGIDGLTFLPLLKGEAAPSATPRVLFSENELYGSAQAAEIRGSSKYLYNMANTSRPERRPRSPHRYELYDLAGDPGEKKNLATKEARALSEMHALLDRHLRPMMAGRYVLALDGGGAPHCFAGTLTLPPRANWFSYYEDVIAPLADGSEGPLKVSPRGNRLTFEVNSSRALLSFKPERMPETDSGVELELSVDGQPWTGGVSLGAGGSAGTGQLTLRLADTQLELAPEALPDPVSDRVSVFIGRTTRRSLEGQDQKSLPAETAERLKALGYIQ